MLLQNVRFFYFLLNRVKCISGSSTVTCTLYFRIYTHVGLGKGHEHTYTRGVWIYTRGSGEGHGTRAYLHTCGSGEGHEQAAFQLQSAWEDEAHALFPVGLLHVMYSHTWFSIHIRSGKTYFNFSLYIQFPQVLNVSYTPLQFKPQTMYLVIKISQ